MNLLYYIDAIVFVMGTWALFFSFSCTKLGGRFFSQFNGVADRLAITLIIALFTLVGWTKGPITPTGTRPLFNLVMALRTGGLTGDNGVLARKTELETVRAFAEYSETMIQAGSNALAGAMARFDAAEFVLTNNPPEIVYIQSYFPREDPTVGLVNHNLAVLAMTQSSVDDVLSRWVRFSDDLVNAPVLYAEVSLDGASHTRLTEITNTWPNVEIKQGVECVRYDYRLPNSLVGIVLSPDYDLRFGSDENGLQIGAGGLTVTDVNGAEHIAVDGWREMCSGRVQVLYKAGSAVRVLIDGQQVANGVYTL